jgi:hypothetical protein
MCPHTAHLEIIRNSGEYRDTWRRWVGHWGASTGRPYNLTASLTWGIRRRRSA